MEFYAFNAAYVERLQAGDASTEEHFVSYFRELIRLKLRSRLTSKEAIEDVEQETFVRVLTALRTGQGLRHGERLGAYVNSVCNHVLMEHYRGQRRIEPVDDHVLSTTLAEPGPDAFAQLMAKDLEQTVREILNKMSERDQLLLRGVLLEGRDKDEVCRDLGVGREYLRVLLHRAKQSFKSRFISHVSPQNQDRNRPEEDPRREGRQ